METSQHALAMGGGRFCRWIDGRADDASGSALVMMAQLFVFNGKASPLVDDTYIPVSRPDLSTLERQYLLDAFDSTWISGVGDYIDRFEDQFAHFVGVEHAVSCVNGTSALHLALLSLDIGPGDEVIVPDLTYVATANAVRYVGATPVFADCDPCTWNVDANSVARMITDKTRGIIVVHLLGVPADVTALRDIADQHACALIEDASEAHGAQWRESSVGSFGDLATFSFFGNKVLATGEGGMVCTRDARLAQRVRKLKGQGVAPEHHYFFDEVGYNYRMTNLAAAIGVAQLERFAELYQKREKVRRWYDANFGESTVHIKRQLIPEDASPVAWMYGVVLDDELGVTRDEMRQHLADRRIETRPFFYPLSRLPIYDACRTDDKCPHSWHVSRRGIMLPTHTQLSRSDVARIVAEVRCCCDAGVTLS